MKLGAADIPKLQIPLLVMVLMIAIGAGTILYSREQTKLAHAHLVTAQRNRNEIDAKLTRVRREETEIKQKSSVFNALQARGILGDEQRLEWVELLKEIRDKHRLLELRYEITPQHALEKTPAGNFALFASTMKLELKLLHEEDLTRFLDDLRQQARALIQVKRCNVSRLPRSVSGNAPQAQLRAECLVDWVTMRESEPAKGTGR